MTSTDTAGHPDVAEISDLTEGLLPASRAEDVRRHLHACASCTEVWASLEEIRGLLGALPEQEEMPHDVAERIDAALAAERDAVASGTEGGAEDGGTHVSRETPVANRPAGHARPSRTGPGRKPDRPRGRRRVAVLGAAFAVAALGVASAVIVSHQDDQGPGTQAQGRPSASADAFSEATLQNRVTQLLDTASTAPGAAHTPHSFGADSETGGPRVLKSAPTASVPPCVRQGIDDPGAALAAQRGVYRGTDSFLVVLPDASGDGARVTAYVVDAACVHRPSAAARVLFTHSYPRS
ncbi:hypothetical protein [Streptomyces sp. NPDC046985]|uniref:hypothetical protein n=1 Tax=Streptomyces sp. NPDC046985 TaxID=3155377 RepID=UPI0033CEC431